MTSLRALTVWQPWATLIILGAKPHEFRRWRAPAGHVGQRIVIHAGARPVRKAEALELLWAVNAGEGTGLVRDTAGPLLERVLSSKAPLELPTACGLGTALLGEPQRCTELFRNQVFDSGRVDEHMWAWPMEAVERWDAPVPARGLQGFWRW